VSLAPPQILVVDDEESVLMTLAAVLRREGYEVHTAGTGSQALQAIRKNRFDLLLSDLRIDEIDGLTLLAAAQKRDPETVTILLTGYASLESAVQALRHGAFNYLLKPCNIDEMKLAIERGLEKKRLSEALRTRAAELEQANRTIQSINESLEEKVTQATAELAERIGELQESRRQLTAVIDSMQDGLLVYDSAGRVVQANPFALQLFSSSYDDMMGLGSVDVAKLTGEPPLTALPSEETADRPVVFEFGGPRPRFVRRIVSSIPSEAGRTSGCVVVYQDITDQKEVEQLKDDFLSIASHELKTPLTSIMGYTQLLGRKLGSANAAEVLDVIQAQCRRMNRLVEDLLDVSRIERGGLETAHCPVTLPTVVEGVLAKFRTTSHRHEFRVLCHDEGITVWADEDRLDQVLSNLVSNAIKYSPDGGAVEVTIKRREQHAEVAVRDWGIGIAPEQQSRIFSRFYQADSVVRSRRFGGMGLGLFICKAIIDEMGGTISVESAVGHGSTFRVSLPLWKR